ncbi:SDR family oxidoreductase [Photobacterium sp. DNB22_13_2]
MSKTVLITGANRGVGLALTVAYLEAGWQVYASCRDIASASELTRRQNIFPHLSIVELDATDHEAVLHLAQSMETTSLDLLINNAGYYGPKGYGFGNTDVDEWRKVFEINAIAPLKIAEAFYPQLKQGSPGVIACISSKVGSMAENTSGGGYIYRSSKAALNSVVKSLSNDLQPEGIITVALHPGWVQTEMGGPNALIEAQASAAGLKKVIDNLTPADSGLFMDYQGNYLPW